MKSKLFKVSSIILLLQIAIIGCESNNEQDEKIWEIYPGYKNSVIQNEVNGIEFKFCLLNEDGEPATVFNEGDNFSFYFSVTNNRNEKLCFDPTFAYSENDFCRVYNSENQDLGRPFNTPIVVTIGPGAYPFKESESYIFKVPWIDDRDSWGWSYGSYESTHQEPLQKGSYYTGFKCRFSFHRTHYEPSLEIDTLSFRINFIIQ